MSLKFVDYVPVMVALLTTLAGIVTWALTERSKRQFEDYKRREARYVVLVRALRGFQNSTPDRELKQKFLTELELCWLYGSDDVVRAGYAFLDTVKADVVCTDAVKEAAVGELVLAIRKDLIRRQPLKNTALLPREFQILSVS